MSDSVAGESAVAPTIVTERLTLRAHRTADLDACAAMWADPRVTQFIGGKPSSRQQTWARILGYAGHWSLLRFGYWAVEESAGGAFVGEVGFADFKRALEPSLEEMPELGWALTPIMHGRDYATEALRAAICWGDRNFSAKRTACIINPANAPSIRLAQKCGYREWQRAQYNDAALIVSLRETQTCGDTSL